MLTDSAQNLIILADTQFLVIESLKSLLEKDFPNRTVGIVANCSELFDLLAQTTCQLLIADPETFDFNGIDDLRRLKEKNPHLTILILTNAITLSEFKELNKAGIKNIIYKTAGRNEILNAIELALKGKKYYSDEVLGLIVDEREKRVSHEESGRLTPSEIEIVRLISGGLTTKEIAHSRNISFHTVNTHRKNIFRKAGVSNSSELIMYAIRNGLIDNIEYYI